MNQPSFSSRRILRPVRPWFIWLSLTAALVINLMPLGRAPILPDWVALVLCFWCVREPLRVGMVAGFVLGLLMDVGYGSLMGQHALAYVLLAYAAGTLSRRILWFGPLQQSLHVLPMLVGTQAGDAAGQAGRRCRLSGPHLLRRQRDRHAAVASDQLPAAVAAVPPREQGRKPADLNMRRCLRTARHPI
jgi:rod shape-determining protein MreD